MNIPSFQEQRLAESNSLATILFCNSGQSQSAIATADCFDRLGFGLLVISKTFELSSINRIAAKMLMTPSPIFQTNKKLSCRSEEHQRRLHKAITVATKRNDNAPIQLNCSQGGGVTVIVDSVISATTAANGPLITLVIQPSMSDRIMLLRSELSERYGITLAESEVLKLVVMGLPSRKIAELRGTSCETVRSQIKSICAKTGCQRQTQLLSLAAAPELFHQELSKAA